MKHSNVYYTRETDGTYKPCKNATGVRNDIGADIFRFKGLVYEGTTGVFMFNESKLAEFFEGYRGKEDKFKEIVEKTAAHYGLSPRYTQPEVKKNDLFPHDESRKLANTLYHKEKCYFSRTYNENGFELYTMDKEKASSPTLYVPCNGWMIGIGPQYELEKALAFLTQPDFNLYAYIVNQYETSLGNPDKWADTGIAEFLGRRGEADEHNRPIEERRDTERTERSEKREAEQRERGEQARQKYETAIEEAEKAILDGWTVDNKEIGGRSLILQLFRENGIKLPLKTQGWVKSSLAEIHHTGDNGWSYSYYGRKGSQGSTVFRGYIKELADAIQYKRQYAQAEPDAGNEDNSAGYGYENGGEDDMEI